MTMIEDGRGSGRKAMVDEDQHLVAKAVTIDHAAYHCISTHHQDLFSVWFKHTQAVDATAEIAGYIKYTGNKNLAVQAWRFSTDSAGKCEIEIVRNPTTISGGADATIANMHYGSNYEVSAVAKTANDSTPPTITGGTPTLDVFLGWHAQPFLELTMGGAPVLPKNESLALRVTCPTAGDKTRIGLIFFEEEEVEGL